MIRVLFLSALTGIGQVPPATNLEVNNAFDVTRGPSVVDSAVVLPQGFAYTTDQLSLISDTGENIPLQAEPLGLAWPDGSLRRVLSTFPVPAISGKETLFFKLESNQGDNLQRTHYKAIAPIKIQEGHSQLTIDTGALLMTFQKQPANKQQPGFWPQTAKARIEDFWHPLWDKGAAIKVVADREHMTPEEFKRTGRHHNSLWTFGIGNLPFPGRPKGQYYHRYALPDATVPWVDWSDQIEKNIDYSHNFTGPVNLEWERQGPWISVLKITPQAEPKEGNFGYTARWYFEAGNPEARLELTIHNYETHHEISLKNTRNLLISNSKHLREFQITLPVAFKAEQANAVVENNSGEHSRKSLKIESLLHWLQDSSEEYKLNQQNPTTGKLSGAFLFQGSNPAQRLSLGTRWFWEIFPKGLRYNPDNRELSIELWPAQSEQRPFPYSPGRQRTYVLTIGSNADVMQSVANARQPLRAWIPTEESNLTQVELPVIEMDNSSFPSWKSYAEKTYQRYMSERLYGDLDFGDVRGWTDYSRSSNYHGIPHEFLKFYKASGDYRYLDIAEAGVYHNTDIDTVHWGKFKGGRYKQHTRGEDHTAIIAMGGIANWTHADIDYHLMTGSQRTATSLENNLKFLLQAGGIRRGNWSRYRATTLPLKHIVHMYEIFGRESTLIKEYPELWKRSPKQVSRNQWSERDSDNLWSMIRDTSHYLVKTIQSPPDSDAFQQSSFQASYPPEALWRVWRLTKDSLAREGVLLYADYFYKEHTMPSGTPFYSQHARHRPNDKWMVFIDEADMPAAAALDISGNAWYAHAVRPTLNWRLQVYGIATHYYGFGSTLPTTLWYLQQFDESDETLSQFPDGVNPEQVVGVFKEFIQKLGDQPVSQHPRRELVRILTNLNRFDEAREWLKPHPENPHLQSMERYLSERENAAR